MDAVRCIIIIFCIKIALVIYWGPQRNYFQPTPPPLKIYGKEVDNLFIIFCEPFRKLFVEFVVFLTHI